MADLLHFILIYSVPDRALVDLREFGTNGTAAIDCYAELEREYRGRSDTANFEIVLIGADSIDTVKKTHSHYFGSLEGVPFRELVGA